jgi:hypothetical protein
MDAALLCGVHKLGTLAGINIHNDSHIIKWQTKKVWRNISIIIIE